MLIFARTSLIILLVIAISVASHAQLQCTPGPPNGTLFTLDASGGSPVPVTLKFNYTLKNDTDVLIRVTNIWSYRSPGSGD